MAASYMSDRSSIAPTDFAICSSFDEENGVISVAVENCQLCGGGRRPFYCPSCVKSGDFYHSADCSNQKAVKSSTHHPKQRYREKILRLQSLRKEKAQLLDRFKQITSKKNVLQQKELEASFARQRVDLLTRAVEEATSKQQQEVASLRALQSTNETVSSRVPARGEKVRRILERLERLRVSEDQRRGELALCEHQLCDRRQGHVRALVEHIYPISQVTARSDSDSVGQSYVSELAEARHTAYIRGRWIYSDNGSEHQYRIVQPTLPGNGDYSAYLNWLLDKSCSPGAPDRQTGDGHPAATIGAALTYTAQLVTLIAYFLDVNLPQRLCYSNFCQTALSERGFSRLVYKLNHNVLYLCFCQRVDPLLLHPRHTVHNILTLLKTDGLGRCRPFDVDPDMLQSLEAGVSAPQPASDTDTDSDPAPDDAHTDWERVTADADDYNVGDARQCNVGDAGHHGHLGDTHSSRVGGLMSTAAASVTSLWRAATWKS